MKSILNTNTYNLIAFVIFLTGCRAEPTETIQCTSEEVATEQGCVPVNGDGGMSFLPTPTLPMPVDDWYAASGYMDDGEDPEARYLSPPQACATRAHDEAVGNCHRFEYRPGPIGRAGVYWQYPADNWGDMGEPGLSIPAGAQSIRFYAWSDTPDTVVKFMAGLSEAIDGFSTEITNIALTTEPTQYTLDLRNSNYDTVIGAFGWYANAMGDLTTIHVDDIHWSEAPPFELYEEPELVLPLSVQAWFSASGYMGDGEDPESRYLSSPQPCLDADSETMDNCTQFTYDSGPAGGAGVYWQYPADNWGLKGDECTDETLVCDTAGLKIPQGAQSIQFTAWTNQDTHSVEFLAGISEAVDGFRVARTITLTNEPTEYSIDLSAVTYDEVIGGFGWYASAAETALVLSIRDITWSTEPYTGEEMTDPETPSIPSHPDAPLTLPYPLLAAFSPSGLMPAAASTMVAIAGCTVEATNGLSDCIEFTTTPGSSPWAGVWWHTVPGGWMGPPAELPAGVVGIEFYAWADRAGIFRKFGSGDTGASDPFAVE